MAEEKKTKICKTCEKDLSLENYSVTKVARKNFVIDYYRHECKACCAKKRTTIRRSGLRYKLTDTEIELMKLHREKYTTMSLPLFRETCGITMGIQSLYRYARLGQLEELMDSLHRD